MFTSRFAITFGEMKYTHDGLKEGQEKNQYSFSVDDLKAIQKRLQEMQNPFESKLIKLEENLPEQLQKEHEAAVLYLPGFAKIMMEDQQGADKLYQEQKGLEYDKKYYDKTMKKTFNRKARYHLIFGNQGRHPSEDYKEYKIQAFSQLQYLKKFREKLGDYFAVNQKLNKQYLINYYAEGVHYYNQESGLGFHGDDGRKVVIGLCLGKTTTIRYCWRKPLSSNNDAYDPIDLKVNHGDIYIMSEKATGNDWKKRNRYRVVHGAGASKYTNV